MTSDDLKEVVNKRTVVPWLPLLIILLMFFIFWRWYILPRENKTEKVEKVVTSVPSTNKIDAVVVNTNVARVVKKESQKTELSRIEAVSSVTNVATVMTQAKELEMHGNIIGAIETYRKALKASDLSENLRDEIENQLGRLNMIFLTNSIPGPGKGIYEVKPGDSLERIARRTKTTVELLEKMNNIHDPHRIRPGMRIAFPTGKFEVFVSRKTLTLTVSYDGEFFKKYRVALGMPEKPTPTGTFVITEDKQKEPVWWKDNKPIPYGHPDNLLGTRWMAIKATSGTPDVQGYGIHGTWDETSIGKYITSGCIRMTNRDVEELYMLLPAGTRVIID
jgi:lipoprotein-anchoring transpeptidase ErfK/SrfK